MTNFTYNYTYIPADTLHTLIKEELKSYFQTGVIDDILFPIYTREALRELSKKGTLPIKETVLFLKNFQALLPPDFKYPRIVAACAEMAPVSIRKPGSYYSQVTSKLDGYKDRCDPCDPCIPVAQEVIYKTNTYEHFTTKAIFFLKPGNLKTEELCGNGCFNIGISSGDTFSIDGKTFTSSLREVDVYLMYYSDGTDENGEILIPDEPDIKNFVSSYIKYKMYEHLWNSVTDESFNQIQAKLQYWEHKKDEAYINATTEMKKQTREQKLRSIQRNRNRLKKFNIR